MIDEITRKTKEPNSTTVEKALVVFARELGVLDKATEEYAAYVAEKEILKKHEKAN